MFLFFADSSLFFVNPSANWYPNFFIVPCASASYIPFNALSSCIQFTDLSNDVMLAISAFAADGVNFINACALLIEFVAAFLYVESDVNDEPVAFVYALPAATDIAIVVAPLPISSNAALFASSVVACDAL